MNIIVLRTDSPTAYLAVYNDSKLLDELSWPATGELSQTLLTNIEVMADKVGGLKALNGIIVFKGPGSFTGLRIGISVTNTLAYSLKIPIIGSAGDNWINDGIDRLKNSQNDKLVVPEYGAKPNITKPTK